uniref:Uncharacterized protein n=1 Tax=Avena sativa TaxID=4498 RepID=A0ACD5X3P3_AVESA
MCPRATAEHGGAAMWTASAQSFGEEEYIDLDLSSCGEYEFRVCRSRAAASAPCADEMLCRGRLHKVKLPDAEATTGGCGSRRSTATVAPLQHSHARSAQQPARTRADGCGRKAVRARLRVFFRSLFASRTSCSDRERCRGGSKAATPVCQTKSGGGAGPTTTLRNSIELEKLMDEAEEEKHASSSVRQRKSFSGVIRWRPLTTTTAAAGRSRNSCGSAPAALKRSSSCRSESEGLIQGAIAYCKRSQFARKSVGDAALCSSSRA